MRFEQARFSGEFQNLESSIVLSIDTYTKTGSKPIGKDKFGNSIWPDTSYTEVGKLLRDYKYYNVDENLNSLANILADYITHIKELQEYTTLVSCPSSRFINVVELAAIKLKMSSYNCLKKRKAFSMKATFKDNRSNKACLIAYNGAIPPNERIIIVDDIVETGATLQGCMNAIKKFQPTLDIKLLAMARTLSVSCIL